MPTNARQFRLELDAILKQRLPEHELVEYVTRVVIFLASLTIPRTPVDTGRARGGWQISVGSPPSVDTGRLDPSGTATIGSEAAKLAGLPPFEVVYFGNNVAYINELENGSSAQAPLGMLAVSIQDTLNKFPELVVRSGAA